MTVTLGRGSRVSVLNQEGQTETVRRGSSQPRWGVVLPLGMLALSLFLMVLAKRQQPMLRKMGTGWEVPARVINALVNGPGFYLGRLIPIPVPERLNDGLGYDADRISGIALFWFLIGWSIDRRRNSQALDQRYPIRAGVLFASATITCGLLSFARIAHTFCPSPNLTCFDQIDIRTVLRIVVKYPLRTWLTMDLSLGIWLLALSVYFARKAFLVTKRSLKPTAQ